MFKRLTLIILAILVLFSLAVFLRSQYVLPILMYHSVHPQAQAKNRTEILVSSFERQMRFLKEHKYNLLSLDEAANLIKNKKRVPRRTVILTFDDGYRNFYTDAFPILKKYNLKATMFIIVNEVSRPQDDRLSWEEIKTLKASGIVDFGSHGLGPEPLINIKSDEVIKREIFDSKKILESRLGSPVNAFSYPEGRFTDRIRELVREAGYEVAVTTNPGRDFSDDDIYALKRVRISSTSNNLFVFFIESSGYYNFMRERRRK